MIRTWKCFSCGWAIRFLLFIPSNLEKTIVRAIPFIIAGLAVGLGLQGRSLQYRR